MITTNTNGIPAKSWIEKYRETYEPSKRMMFFFIFQEVSIQLYVGISFEINGKRKTMLKDCTSTIVLSLRHSAAKWRIKFASFIKSNREQHIKLKILKIVCLRYISYVQNFHQTFRWYYFDWWRWHCVTWKRRRAQQNLISWTSMQKLLTHIKLNQKLLTHIKLNHHNILTGW